MDWCEVVVIHSREQVPQPTNLSWVITKAIRRRVPCGSSGPQLGNGGAPLENHNKKGKLKQDDPSATTSEKQEKIRAKFKEKSPLKS